MIKKLSYYKFSSIALQYFNNVNNSTCN